MSKIDQLVSVVIAVYNGEKYLAEAIESALAQTYRPIELIVVDDGSTDRSADIACSYEEVRYIYQPNQGLAKARNRGLAAFQGAFISFLDADDIWMPEKLSVQAEHLTTHPHVGLVVCRIQNFLDPELTLPPGVTSHPLEREQINFPAMLVRGELFDQVGGFDPSYKLMSDFDWVVRAKDVGITMVILPEVLMHKRIHEANMSHQSKARQETLIRLVKASIGRQSEKGQ
jgi:glycosyltransferase involved in cell wall biosynthesis